MPASAGLIQPPKEMKMKIELSDQQLHVIDQALQQLPYNVAASIIEHISREKSAQGSHIVISGSSRSPSLPDGYIYLNSPEINPERHDNSCIKDNQTMLC